MGHLLYLIFRCDFDVMESLIFVGGFWDLNGPMSFQVKSAVFRAVLVRNKRDLNGFIIILYKHT